MTDNEQFLYVHLYRDQITLFIIPSITLSSPSKYELTDIYFISVVFNIKKRTYSNFKEFSNIYSLVGSPGNFVNLTESKRIRKKW